MIEGFVSNVHTMELFFRYCCIYKVNDPRERIRVLRRIVAKHKAVYIRDAEGYCKGKKVHIIRGEHERNTSQENHD